MIAALLLAAAQAAAAHGFPCRLDALPERPEILLIGENHCDAGSQAVKRQAWAQAAAGELAVGQEGLFPGKEDVLLRSAGLQRGPNTLLFGIEQPFSHGLILSYLAGSSGKVCEKTVDDAAYSDVRGISDNEVLKMAWQLTLEDQGGNELLRRSHAARLLQHGAQGRPLSPEEFQALNQRDYDEMLRLLRVMNNLYVKVANRELSALGLTQPLTPLPIETHQPPTPQEAAQQQAADASVEAVIVPVRNRMMVANLEHAYCDAAQARRAFVAVVGAAHVPGMEELLKADSRGLLEISSLKSWEKPELVKATLRIMGLRHSRSSRIAPAPVAVRAPNWR